MMKQDVEGVAFTHLVEQMRLNNLNADTILSSIKSGNYIACGTNNEVYRIDGLEGYLARKPLRSGVPRQGQLEKVADIFAGKNIGQPVARVGWIEVLIKQNGVSLAIPGSLLRDEGYKLERLRVLSSLPQKAFDDLAYSLIELNDRELFFDPVPGNLMIDEARAEIGLIDVIRCHSSFRNDMESLVAALLRQLATMEQRPEYGQVLDKIKLAALRTGLPESLYN